MITIESKGKNVILFGREQDGKATVLFDTTFKPYFYTESITGNFRTIDGKFCEKVFCLHPSDVRKERENYKKTFEADIRYTNRYIIDKIEKLNKEPIRICYLDIETARTEKGYEDPKLGNNPILCIGVFDNFNKEMKQFCLNANVSTEKELLINFLKYIKNTDPDMIIAWNGDGFDFPLLVSRINKLGLDSSDLARHGEKPYISDYDTKVFGRVMFDLMRAYKKMQQGGRESWSLDYISQYHKLGGKEKFKGKLDDLFKNDLSKFLEYNKRDVELLVLLNEKLGIVNFFDEVRRLCFCKFEDVFMNTKMADCLCLKYAKDKFVLPNSKTGENEKSIKGAYVKDSEPKLHRNIAVMDMKSLYPSIMLGFNTSYETLIEKNDNCINMFDTYFYRKERGIIPSIVKPLLDKRREVAKQLEKHDKDSIEYKSLDVMQYALKVIANSFYGVLLEPHFRLSRRDVGQSITFAAQNIIKEVHKWFEDKNVRVIYGDTDSCFLEMGNLSIEEVILLNKDINQYFKEYFKKFGIEDEYNIFELNFEKVFKTILFKRKRTGEGVKKKYAGRMIWYKGKPRDEINITGFECVRSDSPKEGRKFFKEVLGMILYEKSKEEIDIFIEDFKNKIRTDKFEIEDISFPISISKPLESYGNQIHAKAARYANQKHDAGIKQGDKIKYIFVIHPDVKVVAFKDYFYGGYRINYDKLIYRMVDLKIGPIYEQLGWQYKGIIFERAKKIKKKTFEETLKQLSLWN